MTVRLLITYAIIYNLQNTYLMLSRISIKIGVKNEIIFLKFQLLYLASYEDIQKKMGQDFLKNMCYFELHWILFEKEFLKKISIIHYPNSNIISILISEFSGNHLLTIMSGAPENARLAASMSSCFSASVF